MPDLNPRQQEFAPNFPPPESEFDQTQKRLEAETEFAAPAEAKPEGPAEKKRAVDSEVTVDPALKPVLEQQRQQVDSVDASLPEEARAQLLTDVLNSNHREEIDWADLNNLATGAEPENKG